MLIERNKSSLSEIDLRGYFAEVFLHALLLGYELGQTSNVMAATTEVRRWRFLEIG